MAMPAVAAVQRKAFVCKTVLCLVLHHGAHRRKSAYGFVWLLDRCWDIAERCVGLPAAVSTEYVAVCVEF